MLSIPNHREQLIFILQSIYSDVDLASSLGFKGGTACYFFYNLPRFSTDLDFNLLRPETTEQVKEKIHKILISKGTIKTEYEKENTLFFLYSYGEQDMNIKVEISKRDYRDEFELMNFMGISIPVMKREFMFAHKLVAITDRRNPASRDLFDIDYFFAQDWPINDEIIKRRTGEYPIEYFPELVTYIEENFPINKMLDGLGETISAEQKRYVKHDLKPNVISKIQLYLSTIKNIKKEIYG